MQGRHTNRSASTVSRPAGGPAMILIFGLILGLTGCRSEAPASPRERAQIPSAAIDPPAGAGALAPSVAAGRDGTHLVWIEPLPAGGHRLLASMLPTGEAARSASNPSSVSWRAPVEVARGDQFFANWADTPAVVEAANGALYAHWLEKLGEGTYAYGVQVARSRDGGRSWRRLGWLHDDRSATEHGFVSWVSSPRRATEAEVRSAAERSGDETGAVEAVWLDGRGTATGGPMQLRTARLDGTEANGDEVEASVLLASSVCDCCPTAMAVAAEGPVVAFRGRSSEEVRDIHLIRRTEDGWQPPIPVGSDAWTIAGCPVNGPAIAAVGQHVAVAWFTAAGGEARVQVAFSTDGGASMGPAISLDDAKPVGRVGIAAAGDQFVVTWIGRANASDDSKNHDNAVIRLARLPVAAEGKEGVMVETVASTASARSAGIPRLVRADDHLLVVWVEASEPSVLRATAIRI